MRNMIYFNKRIEDNAAIAIEFIDVVIVVVWIRYIKYIPIEEGSE